MSRHAKWFYVTTYVLISALTLSAAAAAKDSLGVYSNWAAFRDAKGPRCYAIAKPQGGSKASFASIASWPRKRVRNQIHIRLPGSVGKRGANLVIDGRRFALATKGRDAWAQNTAMDASIVAALRSASTMRVSGRDTEGRAFTENYSLKGVATAIDAAVVGCASS